MSAGEAIGVTTGSILAGLLVDHVKLNTLLNTQAIIYLIAGLLAFILVKPEM
jgi:predicted MFS family arabinose efflux permease